MLSKVTRDVLAVFVSTIASELTFSIEGHILDLFRSSLSSLRFKILFVLKTGYKPLSQFLFANQRTR